MARVIDAPEQELLDAEAIGLVERVGFEGDRTLWRLTAAGRSVPLSISRAAAERLQETDERGRLLTPAEVAQNVTEVALAIAAFCEQRAIGPSAAMQALEAAATYFWCNTIQSDEVRGRVRAAVLQNRRQLAALVASEGVEPMP